MEEQSNSIEAISQEIGNASSQCQAGGGNCQTSRRQQLRELQAELQLLQGEPDIGIPTTLTRSAERI